MTCQLVGCARRSRDESEGKKHPHGQDADGSGRPQQEEEDKVQDPGRDSPCAGSPRVHRSEKERPKDHREEGQYYDDHQPEKDYEGTREAQERPEQDADPGACVRGARPGIDREEKDSKAESQREDHAHFPHPGL